jgi:hypothetical protein
MADLVNSSYLDKIALTNNFREGYGMPLECVLFGLPDGKDWLLFVANP